MSLVLQNPLSNPIHRIKPHLHSNTIPKLSIPPKLTNPNPFQFLSTNNNCFPFRTRFYYPIKAYNSSTLPFQDEHERRPNNNLFNFDAFLSCLESICVISSVIISVGCVVNWVFFRNQNAGLVAIGNRVLVWLLAAAVAVGSVIRNRQWRRVCGLSGSRSRSKPSSENGNVVERIEKLEESMRSATTIIRMLSRQLEKLGVRFRVTRKTLKDPISETAALAQKNSEATRALAAQEDILEKELAEVQKVLLAMQDQQYKQLELILAIANSGKLLETKTKPPPSQGPGDQGTGSADTKLRKVDGQQNQAMVGQTGTGTNDKAYGS